MTPAEIAALQQELTTAAQSVVQIFMAQLEPATANAAKTTAAIQAFQGLAALGQALQEALVAAS